MKIIESAVKKNSVLVIFEVFNNLNEAINEVNGRNAKTRANR